MKFRLSYILTFGIIILSIVIGIFILRNNHQKEIPHINEKSFTPPISSKYIPQNADLTLHWKINPTILPKYIENYQEKVNKNNVNKKSMFIRDSLFKLVSLDFTKDISNLSGEYGSFALFETNNQLVNDWLLVLERKNDITFVEEIESILAQKNIAKNDNSINKENSEKSEIISKKINSTKSIYFFNEKENILISSNPKIIKSSINQLKTNTLSTKERYKNMQLKDNIKDGIVLLEMSPKRIFNLLGQEKDILELNQADKLISSINLDSNKLILEGIIAYEDKSKRSINTENYHLINNENKLKLFDNFILIDNPKQYFGQDYHHPYQQLIASIIQKSITSDNSNLFKIVLENTQGTLIWLKDKEWLVLTKKSDTSKKQISNFLKKEKFLNSNLEFKNKNLEVWSKITTNNKEKYEIEENIEAIIEDHEDAITWSQSLSAISDLDNKEDFYNNLFSENKTDKSNDFDNLIRIHLSKDKTEGFLNDFYPYILLRTMLGNKLGFPKNIDISVTIPKINYSDFIKYKIKLKTS